LNKASKQQATAKERTRANEIIIKSRGERIIRDGVAIRFNEPIKTQSHQISLPNAFAILVPISQFSSDVPRKEGDVKAND
jgi:hypothetical protein